MNNEKQMKLDKTIFKKQSHQKASNHQQHYNKMSESERAEAWWLLMRMAYGYVDKPWPRMDKTIFKKGKQAS
jgi:hypothetical protein